MPNALHRRDETAPVKHLDGIGDAYRCICGRDVIAGNLCFGEMAARTIPKPEKVDWAPLMARLQRHLKGNKASLVISYHDDSGEFVLGSEWGQEAPDSDMAGAAAYAVQPTLGAALEQLLTEAGIK